MPHVLVVVTVCVFLLLQEIGYRDRRVLSELHHHNLEPLAAAEVEGAGPGDGTDRLTRQLEAGGAAAATLFAIRRDLHVIRLVGNGLDRRREA